MWGSALKSIRLFKKKCKICSLDPDTDISVFWKFTDKDIQSLCVNCKVKFLEIQPFMEEQRDRLVNALEEEIQKRRMGIGPQ